MTAKKAKKPLESKKKGKKEVFKKNPIGVFRDFPKKNEELSIFDDEKEEEIDETFKRCGSLDKFDDYFNAYDKSKSEFTVVSYGTTKKIIYGSKTLVFSGIKGEKRPKGMHLIGYVKRDLDKLIEKTFNQETGKHEVLRKDLIPHIPERKPYLTNLSKRNIDWYGTGVEALAIDINHCYWRTAYLLKYITEETYLKGLEHDEYKDGRLIAIGTLGKILSVKKYKDGDKIAEYIDEREYLIYGGFFWSIIKKIHNLMNDLKVQLKEDYLMFLTDCIFLDSSKRDLAIKIMENHGYSTKEYKITFTEINPDKVCWITDKGENKVIKYHNSQSPEKN